MHVDSPSIRFPGFADGWKQQHLGDFFRSSRAKASDGTRLLSVTLNRGLIDRDEIDRKTETSLGADEHLLVREGDIAYNMMRMWQGAFGRSDREGMVSPAYVVLCPLPSADSGYFEYAFRRSRSIYLFWAYSYGLTSDRLRLYANDFLRIPFSAPSLPEQGKIADFLTAVDGRIAHLSQKKALLEAYKKAVMQQLFTQALRFQDDDGNDFPDWEEKRLGDVAQLISGQHLDPDQYDASADGIPYFTGPSDFTSDPASFTKWTKFSAKIAPAGSILITVKGNGVGKLMYSMLPKVAMGRQLMAIRSDSFSAVFLYQFLLTKTRQFVALASGNLIPGLSRPNILSLRVPSPSSAEQTKIANFLTALDRKIEAVAAQIAHTQTWKKGLLQQMFV